MFINSQMANMLDRATEIAGDNIKLAEMLGVHFESLLKIRRGERRAHWRIRAGLRVILGVPPIRAFMEEIASDLEESDLLLERRAAEGFREVLVELEGVQQSVESARGPDHVARQGHVGAGCD